MALSWEKSVLVSQTSPAFLHANSTSHTWPFSALAEIIDNAYDPDVAASKLKIDYQTIHNETALVFTDNGAGMDAHKLHKMLSFGYCEKVEINGHKPVGHYGNGFKSGSMRLGKDAIVFTKHTETMSVGFLSQNFLKKINATSVLVPILSFDVNKKSLIDKKDTEASLNAITQYSLFHSKKELLAEFEAIDSTGGTRIIISDLKRGNDGKLELDFESDPHDIRNSEHLELDYSNIRPVREYTPEYRRSLKEYCSILFLKPRMKIVIRGHKVMTKLVSKSLNRTEKDVYKPIWQNKPIKIIFGFGQAGNDYGVMMYHRNRLIKAYERVGYQKQGEGRGLGVVGVVQVDFLEPIHNKQDFNKTDRYNSFMNALGQKLNEYWTEKTNSPLTIGGVTIIEPSNTTKILPDWTWVQCDNCLKWRRLPDAFANKELPEKWFCHLNPDPVHCRCDVEEEPEDEDELLNKATYQKTHKALLIKERTQKRQNLNAKEIELQRKEEELKRTAQKLQELKQPLANRPGQDNKPTIADLEKARKDLELARKRDQEQQQHILMLQQQKAQIEKNQNQLRNNMQWSMFSLQEQAAGGNKRKPENTVATPDQKKRKTAMQTEEFIVTRNDSSGSDTEDNGAIERTESSVDDTGGTQDSNSSSDVILIDSDDDVSTWKKKKKGKLPKISLGGKANTKDSTEDVKPNVDELNVGIRERSSSQTSKSVSVNDNDNKSDSTEEDVKPDVDELNIGIKAKTSKTLSSSESESKKKQEKNVSNLKRNKSSIGNKSPSSSSKVKNSSTLDKSKSCIHKSVQTAKSTNAKSESILKRELEQSEKSLSSLRTNVRELLKVIVPDLEVKNISYIDDIVVEMIKVNKSEEEENEKRCASGSTKNDSTDEQEKGSDKTLSNDKKVEDEMDIKEEPNI